MEIVKGIVHVILGAPPFQESMSDLQRCILALLTFDYIGAYLFPPLKQNCHGVYTWIDRSALGAQRLNLGTKMRLCMFP